MMGWAGLYGTGLSCSRESVEGGVLLGLMHLGVKVWTFSLVYSGFVLSET